MAGQEGSNKKSKRSRKTTTKKNKPAKGGAGNFQRMDKESPGMEKMPSNAPTMAIAPSDYEHIFHEGNTTTAQTLNGERPSPPPPPSPQQREQIPTPLPAPAPQLQMQPAPPLPPTPAQVIAARTYPPTPMALPAPTYSPPVQPPSRSPGRNADDSGGYMGGQTGQMPYGAEVPVTPDGYTMLGQPTLEAGNNRNRVALPPHVVRASNQFSRAALARVARYLATRGEHASQR